jgi:LCP family protein required for cell wall assembly
MRTTLKRGVSSNGVGANGVPPEPPPPPLTAMTRYGPPRRGFLRTLGRIVVWMVLTTLVAAGGLSGGVWLWWEHSVAATAPKTEAEKQAQEELDAVPAANEPAVALVVGYDRREGPEKSLESRSDTIMLVRVDPRGKTISMVSFPRDLTVELSGCKDAPARVAKINEAFTDCGVLGTLNTVRKLTGIPVNYYVTVDFRSFIEIVNRLGGVYMDVDRRYFNDNEGLGPGQTYSAIDLQPGYQRLRGGDALAYVRYRHLDSDIYRNARQQEFVKAVKQQVSGLEAAFRLPGIVKTITQNVTVGVGGGKGLAPETVLSYAKLAYELPSGNLAQARLDPATDLVDSGPPFYQLTADPAAIQKVVDQFMNPDPEAGDKAAAAATGQRVRSRTRRGPPAAQVNVQVLNGNGVAGAADDATYQLAQRGYPTANGGNADRLDYFKTEITWNPEREGAEGAARDMARLFGDADVVEAPPGAGLDYMLRVVVGRTYQGTLAPVPRDTTPKRQPPKVVADRQHAAALVKVAQRRVDFPLLVPTVREAGSSLSTLMPARAYDIGGKKAFRLVYNGPLETDYWGIQQTSWTDAPILEDPTVVRRIAGREYRLYFNGSKLHMVAFEHRGNAYWVVNTLLDALSNETMLAIAKGLKPSGRR